MTGRTRTTLLEFVQEVARATKQNVPSTLSANEFAEDVAYLTRNMYYDMVNLKRVPRASKVIELDASGTSTYPTIMTMPDAGVDLLKISYNKKTSVSARNSFSPVYYRTPQEFLDMTNSRDSTSSNVTVMTWEGIDYNIKSDTHPSYFTTLDHDTLIFDSHYSTLDTTLMSSKTQVHVGYVEEFSITDATVIPVNLEVERELLAKVIAMTYSEILSAPSPSSERRARKLSVFGQGTRGLVQGSYEDRVNNGR